MLLCSLSIVNGKAHKLDIPLKHQSIVLYLNYLKMIIIKIIIMSYNNIINTIHCRINNMLTLHIL